MRCLSVRQPWAWAICLGEKTIENRTWATDYRGTIAIHASSSRQDVRSVIRAKPDAWVSEDMFVYGAIIGVVDVVDCVELAQELEQNAWAEGHICWKLANPRFVAEPIAMKGKLDLYSLSQEADECLKKQLAQPRPTLDPEITRQVLDAIHPSASDNWMSHVMSYFALERFDDADRVCSSRIEGNSKEGYVHQLRAVARVEAGRFHEAIADADKAIELDPEGAHGAYYSRAMAKMELGDEQGYRADYQRAINLGADLPPIDEADGGP
jgi:tetratricopeptide (TPR) repeat protein